MPKCSKCSQRRKQNQSNQAPVQNGVAQQDFIPKIYLGETGIVTSVLPSTSYGQREQGSRMMVAQVDVNANPDLWGDV